MGSKFVEKHKRKSVLAALLLLFQGRAKYVGILLLIMALSVPFVMSGEAWNGIIAFPPISYFLKTVGLGSVVAAINPKYSNDMLRAALDKAAVDSAQDSFWSKFLKSINATMPPAGSQNSIAMIRGGGDLFGPVEIKDQDKTRRGPGQVKGVVNDAERARGETGDDVNLENLLGNVAGGGGLYGNQMGQNLSGRFGEGGAASGSGPYLNRAMFGGSGGSQAKGSDMYSQVMAQSGGKVPVPGATQKVNAKKMGRVSGFSWKNVGYKTKSATMDTRINSKRSMFQLATTFSMTGSAFKSKDAALEYQNSYVGSTYDGNDVNVDVIQTGGDSAPVVPDTSFAGDLINAAGDLQQIAKECSEAQGTYGAKMSDDAKKMADIHKGMGSPPKCCNHGGIDRWNSNVDLAVSYCVDYNVNQALLAGKCQTSVDPMDCGSISSNHLSKCGWLHCFLMMLLAFLIGALCGILASFAIVGVLGSIFGSVVSNLVSGVIKKVAGGD